MDHLKIVTACQVNDSLAVMELDHAAWDKAVPVSITRWWSGDNAPIGKHAEVRLLWSSSALFAKFVCHQNQTPVVNDRPQTDKKTIGLWDRDVCEVFLAPDPALPEHYFEFEAAPTGEWVDLEIKFVNGRLERNFDFESGMKTAARISGDNITVGLEIPWSKALPKPKPGDEYAINLFRCVGFGNERYLAWQPTFTSEPNFHVPTSFGRLRFL